MHIHTCYKHTWREGGSLASIFKLSIWLLFCQDPITFCTSIIEDNHSVSILGVTEKSKQNFPVTYKPSIKKCHSLIEHGRDYEFLKQGICENLIYCRYTVQ